MKNIIKVLDVLQQAFPGHRIENIYYQERDQEVILCDGYIVAYFNRKFLSEDFDNPEIEIKVKAPLENLKKFISDNYINNYGVREAVERGLREWHEESQHKAESEEEI